MTNADKIRAACDAYDDVAKKAKATRDVKGKWDAAEVSTRDEAKTKLMDLLRSLGFTATWDARSREAYEAKRHGVVVFGSDSYPGARYTPSDAVRAAQEKGAAQKRAAFEERSY